MKFLLTTFLLCGTVFAYTTSPAGNEKVRDPNWTIVNETRDPASIEVKSDNKKPEKKVETPKPKN